jgi:septal ring factor EnvC (AmiA/AmiB activator)
VTHLRAQMIETAARLQAQEDKVSALETALAESVKRDAALKQNLDRNDRSVAQTLTALERIALRPPAAIIGRPVDDAVDTIRTAMLLGAVVPTIEADAAQLRTQIEDLRASRRRTEEKRTSLAGASQALEAERTKLAALVQAKQEQEVGKRAEAAEEAKRAKAISAKADDLKDLIASLDREAAKRRAAAIARAAEQAKARAQELARRKAEAEAQGRSADTVTMPPPKPAPAERQLPAASAFARLKGHIRMPAHGTVVTWYGQKDSYGMRARGITIATRGDATVIAPCAGKVVFAGTFRNYGQLLIISPAHGYHVLLAGLARIDATRGQFLLMGEPVGQMASASRSAAGGAAGIDAEPRLYVEFRRNGEPIDPAQWLASSEKRVTG